MVAIGFLRRDFALVAGRSSSLAHFGVEDGPRHHRRRARGLDGAHRAGRRGGATRFGLLLIDGLCRREEAVISALYAALDDIPVVGGSAGDG